MRFSVCSWACLWASVVLARHAHAQNTATNSKAVAAAQATALTRSPTSNVKGKAFDRFVVIWLENTDYAKAVGDPNLAYLAKKGITLSNYFAVTHPSEPNYVAAIGGDYFGMDNDAHNRLPSNISSIVDLLEDRGISWGSYQEDMPYTGFEGTAYLNQKSGSNSYVRKHNPAVMFDANANVPERLANIKNLTYFFKDLKGDKLPQWMFITPNMTSDGHDTDITTAGTWTRQFLDPLLDEPKFMNNTLVLITFDENHTYPQQNRVLGILLGDAIPEELIGSTDAAYYNHYSEISTVQANWDLHTLGRFDVGANVFSLLARKSGSSAEEIREWTATPALQQMYFNQSYAGLFNSKRSGVPLPSPNTAAVYAGRSVLPKIKEAWGAVAGKTYYGTELEIPDGQHPPKGY